MKRPKDYIIPSTDVREYNSPENRKKHRWKRNIAGFHKFDNEIVGKCPNDITLEEAQRLLLDAIADPFDEYSDDPYPKYLYNVRHGVIYEAAGDGRSKYYHAYPADKINSLDPDTLAELEKRAITSGDLNIFKKWKKDYAKKRTEISYFRP